MSKNDYYEILGVSKSATQDEIKKAFRNRARQLHPDNMDSGDETAFKELAAAYEVLSDDNKRALYDRYGAEGLASGAGGFSGGFENMDLGSFADLSEIFSQFFGTGTSRTGRRNQALRGADLKLDLRLEFKEAIFGCESKITVRRMEDCTVCTGSGAQAVSGPVQCSTCGGAGQIRQTNATLLGHFTQVLTCPNCEGEGTRVEKPCTNCRGVGQVRKSREMEIKIPPGIDNGARVRITKAGDFGKRGGPPGDVYVIVYVSDHATFQREGTTIHVQQKISYSMAALGCELLIPTVDGEQVLKVAAGTQTGVTITVRGKGAPQLSNPSVRGDQIVHFFVETPTKLSAEEKKLLERLAEMRGEKLTVPKSHKHDDPNNSSLLDKITEVFKPKESPTGKETSHE